MMLKICCCSTRHHLAIIQPSSSIIQPSSSVIQLLLNFKVNRGVYGVQTYWSCSESRSWWGYTIIHNGAIICQQLENNSLKTLFEYYCCKTELQCSCRTQDLLFDAIQSLLSHRSNQIKERCNNYHHSDYPLQTLKQNS